MNSKPAVSSQHSEVEILCQDLQTSLDFYLDLGFRLEVIFPADEPREAVVTGHGLRLRFRVGESNGGRKLSARLILRSNARGESPSKEQDLKAPEGTLVQLRPRDAATKSFESPSHSTLVQGGAHGAATVGRAGMIYRELIPGRHKGWIVASQISIPKGGEVPDYEHHHDVQFQMIYCHRGWVRVVYEDQGPAFDLHPGDLVLQPPGIRHRVLESSDGLEVVELGCPAEHPTSADHEIVLPNSKLDPSRRFQGQRFLRHTANSAPWQPGPSPNSRQQDTGMSDATDGLASVLRIQLKTDIDIRTKPGEFLFCFITDGAVDYCAPGSPNRPQALREGSAFSVPANSNFHLRSPQNCTLLWVSISSKER